MDGIESNQENSIQISNVMDEVRDILGTKAGSQHDAKLLLLEKRMSTGGQPNKPVRKVTETHGNTDGGANSLHSVHSGGEAVSGCGKSPVTFSGGQMRNVLQQEQQEERLIEECASRDVVVIDDEEDDARDKQGTKDGVMRKKRRVSKPPVRHGGEGRGAGGGQQRPSLSPYINQHTPVAASQGGVEYQHMSGKEEETPEKQKSRKDTKIVKYFGSKSIGGGSQQVVTETTRGEEEAPVTSSHGLFEETTSVRNLKIEADSLREENKHLQMELKKTQEACDHLETKLSSIEQQVAEEKESHLSRDGLLRQMIVRIATENSTKTRELSLQRLQEAAPRIGTLSVRRRGIEVQEVWEDGSAVKELDAKISNLSHQKERIETKRKAMKRRLPLPGQPVPVERLDDTVGACSTSGPLHPDDWVLQEEIFKVKMASIRREEELLRAQRNRIHIEKTQHIRELKRLRDEEASRFGEHPVLHNRYLLLNLLGKGGFSEVFKALDLKELREVAVKIHQLSSQWSESKKASYVKHSVREYHIHKELHHPRIVSLLDIFEIDNNTFATVLEYCHGGDLEEYMKTHEVLPEREARAVTAQVLSALSYLNVKPRSVIHYDLKPANILFDSTGNCKITDFGLSKVVEDGHTQGMELTSQGAGTYWYLPPECFDVKQTPLISNKVDVWSMGVILYQMLYGVRPFGHDQSQEQILRNEVMLNARQVTFPSKPSISAECKDFLLRCLAHNQTDRMDVHTAAQHPFLAIKSASKAK